MKNFKRTTVIIFEFDEDTFYGHFNLYRDPIRVSIIRNGRSYTSEVSDTLSTIYKSIIILQYER